MEITPFRFGLAAFVSNPPQWKECIDTLARMDAAYVRASDGSYYIPMVFIAMRDQFYVFLIFMTANGPVSVKAFSNN